MLQCALILEKWELEGKNATTTLGTSLGIPDKEKKNISKSAEQVGSKVNVATLNRNQLSFCLLRVAPDATDPSFDGSSNDREGGRAHHSLFVKYR